MDAAIGLFVLVVFFALFALFDELKDALALLRNRFRAKKQFHARSN